LISVNVVQINITALPLLTSFKKVMKPFQSSSHKLPGLICLILFPNQIV